MIEKRDIQVGDWIRYQRGGVLVIGVVAYIRRRCSWDSTPTPWTVEHGEIDSASVLEVRSAASAEAIR